MLDMIVASQNTLGAQKVVLEINTTNISNNYTDGYKALRPVFKTIYNKALTQGYGGHPGEAQENPLQTGPTMTISATFLDMTQGKLRVGNKLSLAINGKGFFLVAPTNSMGGVSHRLLSRQGQYGKSFDDKYIVDTEGRTLMGYKMNADGTPDKSQLVPIQVEGESDIGFIDGGILVNNYQAFIDASGQTNRTGPLPTRRAMYQVALAKVPNEEALKVESGNAYSETPASGFVNSIDIPNATGNGLVVAKFLEESNVFYLGEIIDSIKIQRAWQASLGILQMVVQELKNFIQSISSQ